MDENPFARCDRRESDSYYLASWIFSQIFLVVEHKTALFAKKMHFRANRSACVNAFDMSAGKTGKLSFLGQPRLLYKNWQIGVTNYETQATAQPFQASFSLQKGLRSAKG